MFPLNIITPSQYQETIKISKAIFFFQPDLVVHMDLIRNQRVRTLTQLFKDIKKPLKRTNRFELLENVRKVILELEANTPGAEEVRMNDDILQFLL